MAAYNREEVLQLAKTDTNFLAGLCMPEVFQYLFPAVFIVIWNILVEKAGLVRDFTKIAIGLPRGHGKTTFMKIFVVWMILFSTKKFILVVASTGPLAENIISDICDMLDEPNIKAIFGDWRLAMETDNLQVKKFSFRGKVMTLAAIGAEGSLRGLNIKNERPDFILMEDIQTRENAMSSVLSSKLYTWMIGTLMKAKSPKGCLFVFIGNMYPTPDSILKKLKSNPDWLSLIAGAILADGKALWEELQPLEQLKAELQSDVNMGHPEIFFSEVLNDPETTALTGFNPASVPAWRWSDYDQHMGSFIIIDPGTGKHQYTRGSNAANLDNSCILYCELWNGIGAAVEKWEDKWTPGQRIAKALEIASEKRCGLICVESVAFQATELYWFQQVCIAREIRGIELVELSPRGLQKNRRIMTMLKQLTPGKGQAEPEIYLHPKIRAALYYEIAQWNPQVQGNVDNLLDCVAYIPQVLELYRSLIAIPGVSEDGDWAMLQLQDLPSVQASSPI